jgi:hypothetical protein
MDSRPAQAGLSPEGSLPRETCWPRKTRPSQQPRYPPLSAAEASCEQAAPHNWCSSAAETLFPRAAEAQRLSPSHAHDESQCRAKPYGSSAPCRRLQRRSVGPQARSTTRRGRTPGRACAVEDVRSAAVCLRGRHDGVRRLGEGTAGGLWRPNTGRPGTWSAVLSQHRRGRGRVGCANREATVPTGQV